MTTEITRRMEFDAGHRILGHEGKCANLHGHRYVAEVTVTAAELDTLGRVIDFSAIKRLVGGWIDEHWDHNMLLHADDPLAGIAPTNPLLGGKAPYIFRESNPTAENIAEHLYWIADELLTPTFSVVRVKIWETPNCTATFDPSR